MSGRRRSVSNRNRRRFPAIVAAHFSTVQRLEGSTDPDTRSHQIAQRISCGSPVLFGKTGSRPRLATFPEALSRQKFGHWLRLVKPWAAGVVGVARPGIDLASSENDVRCTQGGWLGRRSSDAPARRPWVPGRRKTSAPATRRLIFMGLGDHSDRLGFVRGNGRRPGSATFSQHKTSKFGLGSFGNTTARGLLGAGSKELRVRMNSRGDAGKIIAVEGRGFIVVGRIAQSSGSG